MGCRRIDNLFLVWHTPIPSPITAFIGESREIPENSSSVGLKSRLLCGVGCAGRHSAPPASNVLKRKARLEVHAARFDSAVAAYPDASTAPEAGHNPLSHAHAAEDAQIVPAKVSEGIEVNAPAVIDDTMTSSSGHEASSPSVDAATSENGLQIDVTEATNASKTSSSLLTPPSEDDQDVSKSKSSPAQLSCEAISKKKKSNGVRRTDEVVRKSGRITRTCDPSAAEFVDNYVDSKRLKQPRVVQPPKGGTRIPNMVPRNKSTKEKDKLSIDMVGPRTRSSLAEPVSPLGGTRRRNIHVELTARIGPDHQANFEPFYACDFVAAWQAEEEPEREELIWQEKPSGSSGYSNEELDEAWSAIRSQYGGRIELDSVLFCFMKHNYNIDALLENIEVEQWTNLPQPFEE
uniref:ELM2 domain-containing protein n=1 Tax=Angiostrongylus cantonensis TaxID=6313 RepID=A0A0K0DJL1_ANGCA